MKTTFSSACLGFFLTCLISHPNVRAEDLPVESVGVHWRTWAMPADERTIEAIEKKFEKEKVVQLPGSAPLVRAGRVFTLSNNLLIGTDLRTGKRIWKYPALTKTDSIIDEGRFTELRRDSPSQLERSIYEYPYIHLLKASDEFVICNRFNQPSYSVVERPTLLDPFGEGKRSKAVEPMFTMSIEREGFIIGSFPDAFGEVEYKESRIVGLQNVADRVMAVFEHDAGLKFVEFVSTKLKDRKVSVLEESFPEGSDKIRNRTGCAVDASSTIAVCAPSGGRIYGVDRKECKTKWTHKYKPVTELDESDRWQFSLARIVGDTAIVAPGDGNWLFCLNLNDGELKWKLPREDSLFAQVVGEHVLLAGPRSLRVVRTATGMPTYDAISLPEKDLLAGRGCEKDGAYLLPVSTDSILSIDLKNGRIVRRYQLGEKPGNLAVTKAGVVSQSALTISHYRLKK